MENSNMKILKGGGKKEPTVEEKRLYKILESLPKPDTKMQLTAKQKYWWYWFGNEFLSTRKLTKVDLVHLQAVAFWMDARNQAYKKIKELGYGGLVQTFKSGASNITGHVSIIEKADKHIADASAHFGMSIRDRVRLKAVQTEKNDQPSLFDQHLQKKYGM